MIQVRKTVPISVPPISNTHINDRFGNSSRHTYNLDLHLVLKDAHACGIEVHESLSHGGFVIYLPSTKDGKKIRYDYVFNDFHALRAYINAHASTAQLYAELIENLRHERDSMRQKRDIIADELKMARAKLTALGEKYALYDQDETARLRDAITQLTKDNDNLRLQLDALSDLHRGGDLL